jgi:hypothetical protein
MKRSKVSVNLSEHHDLDYMMYMTKTMTKHKLRLEYILYIT